MEAIVSGPGDGEPLREDDRTILIKAVQPQLDVLEFTADAGFTGPGPHYHERHVDSFYVLEGELEFPAVGATVVAGPGTYVFAPPETIHAFTTRTGARFLNVHAPETGFVEYMRAVDRGDDPNPADFDVHEVGDDAEERADAIVSRPGVDVIERAYGSLEVCAETPEVSVFVLAVEHPWDGVAPHVHEDHLDGFYVIDGEIDFLLAGERVHAAAGTLVAAPPGIEHGIAPTTTRARLLNLHAPDAGYAASVRR